MPNPYPSIATNLTAESVDVLAAFTDAATELANQGAPSIGFLELQYDGSRILRAWDGQRVDTLSQAEQYRLYQQLGGLFNAALRALLYP